MIIGFLVQEFNIRGSGMATYDYAHYNEAILGNKSIIITPKKLTGDTGAFRKFHIRFPIIFYTDLEQSLLENKVDFLYIISYGRKQDSEKYITKACKNIVHCVFDMSEPHGDHYLGVSKTLAAKFGSKNYLHHMISHRPSKTGENLRKELGIRDSDTVFGRYGGRDTFNLPWGVDVIKNTLDKRSDVYFLFMNTPVFLIHPRVIYLEPTTDMDQKNKFIMTCDANIVFETLGHTFGMACGEYGVNNKPSIVYDYNVWNRAHIDILGNDGIYFKSPAELSDILCDWKKKEYKITAYDYYNPKNIMKEFEKFLKMI